MGKYFLKTDERNNDDVQISDIKWKFNEHQIGKIYQWKLSYIESDLKYGFSHPFRT